MTILKSFRLPKEVVEKLEKVAREENLIAAYEEKKLKSEALIDEAKALIKERKKKEQKAAIAAKKKAQKAG